MSKTVSLINMKGGVGKSTLTVNLAWHLAAYADWKCKVLVVDLDPQFNASQYLMGVTAYENMLKKNDQTVWDIFEQGTRLPGNTTKEIDLSSLIQNITTRRNGGKVDLIASRLELSLSLKNPGQKERKLSKLLRAIQEQYDLILIDCAPTESILTTAAYLSSDYLLVPVKPEYLSSIGLPLLVNSMTDFTQEYSEHHLELLGIIFNATTQYTPEEELSKRNVRRIAASNQWNVFKSEIPFSRSYPKGAREGQPIFRTSYSRSSQVWYFENFAREFARMVKL
jgi:chromosome partitioning protein